MTARIRAQQQLAEPEAPSPTGGAENHVLVCVAGGQDDLRLIRHGALLGERLRARLTVLYVLATASGPRPVEVLHADREFARSVLAPLVEVPAASVLDGIAVYASERDVTHIVLSDARRTPWYAAWQGSLVDDLAGRLEGVEIYVLGGTSLAAHG